MTWHVTGIDLSLTNSGVVTLRGDLERPRVRNVLSSPERSARNADGKEFSTLLDRRQRIQHIAARVIAHALDGLDPESDDIPLFVIEAPFYATADGTKSGSAHDRAWLWGLVVHLLFKHGFVVEVVTQHLKMYATGKGSGRKAGVLGAMPYMFPGTMIIDDNAADAATLAAMGARALGFPVEPSHQRVSQAALAAYRWPTDTARRPTE